MKGVFSLVNAVRTMVSTGSVVLSDTAGSYQRCSYIAAGVCLSVAASMLRQFFWFHYSEV